MKFEKRLMPISFADGWEAIEEERRLLYVGITRAREYVFLSYSGARTPGARATRAPSRFLDGLLAAPGAGRSGRGRGPAGAGAGGAGPASGAGSASGAGRRASALPSTCRTCGSTLTAAAERKVGRCSSCPPTYDEGLLDRLRHWRAETAASAKVPPYVVFTDATLVALAERLPATEAALAAVPGVGPTKLKRYGDDVLAILTDVIEL
jgi:DNA helicase-2/ATP-dependent DNA helicase PcrA